MRDLRKLRVRSKRSARFVSRLSVELTGTHFAFTLPAQKTDHLYEGDRVLIQRLLSAPDSDDPWSLFQRYLVARDSSFPLHPYLWIRADGSIPTRSWFLSRLRRLFPPLLVAILCALVVPLLWRRQVSLPLKSKLLGVGPLRRGSATFASIPCFSSLSSFMVVLFMPPLSPLSHLIPPNSLSTHLNSPIVRTSFRSYSQFSQISHV